MAEHQLPKLRMRVRSPSSAPTTKALVTRTMATRAEIEHPTSLQRRALNVPRTLELASLSSAPTMRSERIGDRPVTARRAVLVDQRRIDAHVPHPTHQLPVLAPEIAAKVVPGVPQVVEVDTRQIGRLDRPRPDRREVRPGRRACP